MYQQYYVTNTDKTLENKASIAIGNIVKANLVQSTCVLTAEHQLLRNPVQVEPKSKPIHSI